jgi:hypothetical protein
MARGWVRTVRNGCLWSALALDGMVAGLLRGCVPVGREAQRTRVGVEEGPHPPPPSPAHRERGSRIGRFLRASRQRCYSRRRSRSRSSAWWLRAPRTGPMLDGSRAVVHSMATSEGMGQGGARRVTARADGAPPRLMPLSGMWESWEGRCEADGRPRSLDYARKLASLGMTKRWERVVRVGVASKKSGGGWSRGQASGGADADGDASEDWSLSAAHSA